MKKVILTTTLTTVIATGLTGCIASQTVWKHGNCDFTNGCSSTVSEVVASEHYH